MKVITMYESFDGMRFSSEEECIEHEKKTNPGALIESWLAEKTKGNPIIIQDDDFNWHAFNDAIDAAPFLLKCIKGYCCPGNFNNNPIGLFNYCVYDGTFGDICTIYCYNEDTDSFINVMLKNQP